MKLKKSLAALCTAAVVAISSLAIHPTTIQAATPIFQEQDYVVLTNIIGAVESGGQVYGNRNYGDYAAAYQNSAKEYTCTLGWAQFYGAEARTLIQRIYNANPSSFKAIDSQGLIQSKLNVDWVAARWNPNAAEKNVLIRLITSDTGKAQQDLLFRELVNQHISACANQYTNDVQATMLYVEIAHLGGTGPAQRIFNRLNGDYSPDSILASLLKDQQDTSNNNQVGDKLFESRHRLCVQWVKQYARSTSSNSGSGTNSSTTITDESKVGAGQTSVYRLYNPNSGEHFYTTNRTESNMLSRVGWNYEGVGWVAPVSSSVPVYRLYNPNAGEHIYTINSAERNQLVSVGWKDEGVAFYSDPNHTVAVYREYNPNQRANNHNFSTSRGEHNYLIRAGWRDEGVAWYAAA